MANRFWVGGSGTWNTTNTVNWSDTSGGAGGASVPTSADTVTFDQNSNATAYTVTIGASVSCSLLFMEPPLSGNITWAGTGALDISARVQIASSRVTRTYTGTITFSATSGPWYNTFGVTLASPIVFNGVGGEWLLNTALTTTGSITVTNGTFTTNNYNVTASSLSSSNSNTRTINLGSSTVTLSLSGIALNLSTQTGLTFNAGTSSILFSGPNAALNIGTGVTFYNVSLTSTAITNPTIVASNTFNNLTVAGRTSAGIGSLLIYADQTINGTLTLSAGANATARTFVRSHIIGTTRTLTCAAVASLTDIDFRDITIAGAAAPVSGTRLGDCKGNSGITFATGVNKYWVASGNQNWGAGFTWSLSTSGGADVNLLPLAQDTAIFTSSNPGSGATITINAAYNIGTIDMSARTSNTMTLATGTQTPAIYGNWINGTGVALTGTGTLTFAGRGSQTITSAGKTFTQGFTVNSPGGSVTLQDAFTSTLSGTALNVTAGTIDANGYNVTFSNASANINVNNSNVRTVAIGAGTWTVAGSGNVWNATTSTNLTVTGTGTISLTSASGKNFIGGSLQTYPTINQGGTGTLTITGSNKFANITNTAIGSVLFTGGTTNEFTSFTLSGSLGTPLQLGSTNTTQAILLKPTSWQMGLLSTDAGNNTGLIFLSNDGTMEYLSVSYINGQTTSTPVTSYLGNFFAFF